VVIGNNHGQEKEEEKEEKEIIMATSKYWVFAVHKWETTDEKHHVTSGTDKKHKTKKFKNWENAEIFAKKRAKKLRLKSYQVDTPSRPHKFMKV